MAENYPINYYYCSPEDLKRIDLFRKVSGDSEIALISQYVRGFLGINRKKLLKLARLDIASREMSWLTWGKTVFAEGMEALPPRKNNISSSPFFSHITLPKNKEKRRLNYLLLGLQNTILLKFAIFNEGDSPLNFVSCVVAEHLERHWYTLYAPQVEAENFDNWSDEILTMNGSDAGGFTKERIQEVVNAILSTLGTPKNSLHREAREAFIKGDYQQVDIMASTNLADFYCKSLAYLGGAFKLTPDTPIILAESARAAADFSREEILLKLGSDIKSAFD